MGYWAVRFGRIFRRFVFFPDGYNGGTLKSLGERMLCEAWCSVGHVDVPYCHPKDSSLSLFI